jgi:mono/diheme cytochrome c family protein
LTALKACGPGRAIITFGGFHMPTSSKGFRALLCAGVLAMAGCASVDDGGPRPITPQERGYNLAQRQCAVCHLLSPAQEGLRSASGAPSFRDIARRYNVITFQRRLQQIAEGSHDMMPPTLLTPNEAEDLAAYITAINSPVAPCVAPAEPSCAR